MNEIRGFIKHILKSRLLILGFLIYFLFNISALKTKWFDYFFFGSSIHYCCQGLDFYGIPNGVYSFMHGGKLSGSNLPGNIKPYSQDIVSNPNDYHPITALTLGSFLILFDPHKSFYVWMILKIVITIPLVFYIYRNFSGNKFLNPAIFIFLTNFSQYNEIRISQYQFIFNAFLLVFLINLAKNGDKLEGGVLFFLTLIAKPISLLWTPVLLIKRHFKLATIGLGIFLISTLTFNFLGIGKYFTDNLTYHILNPKAGNAIDYMSLDAFLRYTFHVSTDFIKYLKYIVLGLVYILAFNRKTHILSIIFLLLCYFLFFYDNLFQYHYSIFGPLLCVCLLALPSFQTRIARILILTINFPIVFFILRLLNIEFNFDPVYGPNPTITGWQIVSFFQLLPIILLSVIIFIKEIPDVFWKKLNLFKNE